MSPLATALFESALVGSVTTNHQDKTGPACGGLTICADGDSAGQKTADKLAERLHRTGYCLRMAPSPQGQDFNDILREDA